MRNNNMFDFTTFPELITERLVLRKLRLADAADLLVFRGDYEVQKYNGPVLKTIEEAQNDIRAAHTEYDKQEGISWAVTFKDADKVLGSFAFHHWSHKHRRAEVGYDLARAYWGQGIASETLRAMIPFGFEQMNLNRIYASTIADNHESVRLLEKIGFLREGTKRKSSWEDNGTFHDSAMYGLLRDEYTQGLR